MCSRDEVILYNGPVLFPSISITYVITIEGSNRYESVLHELNTYRPTRKVIIVHHKPMAECARPSWVTKPSDDLWNNNLSIAKRDPSIPVLVLEDDVKFLPRLRDYAQHIDKTVSDNECEVYSLGIVCFLCLPWKTDIKPILGGGAQAVFFSAKGRQRLVREYADNPSYKTKDITQNLNLTWLHDGEIYYEFETLAAPEVCAVQAFPMTENQQEWGNYLTSTAFEVTGARKDGTFLFELSHNIAYHFFGFIPLGLLNIVLVFYLIKSLMIYSKR